MECLRKLFSTSQRETIPEFLTGHVEKHPIYHFQYRETFPSKFATSRTLVGDFKFWCPRCSHKMEILERNEKRICPTCELGLVEQTDGIFQEYVLIGEVSDEYKDFISR